jgi:hypothetical protein
MTPEVEQAIKDIQLIFDGHRVDVEPESQGGAYLRVYDLLLGDRYVPTKTWVGFLITFQYPRADVYPHFIDSQVRRADGRPHGVGFSGPIQWRDHSALQISRRSNRLNPAVDTAATKLAKVLEWIRMQ